MRDGGISGMQEKNAQRKESLRNEREREGERYKNEMREKKIEGYRQVTICLFSAQHATAHSL